MNTKSILSFLLFFIIISGVNAQSPLTIDVSKKWHFAPDEKNKGLNQKWYSNDFDDTNWAIIDTGKRWEDQGYPLLDSFGWYRKLIHIPADWKEKDVWLKFGGTNDVYQLFINGKKIVSFDKSDKTYAFTLSITNITKYIKYGENNLVTVQLNDRGSNGGLWRLPVIITIDEKEANYELDKNFQISVKGDEQQQVNLEFQDGGLKPLVGVQNIQIYRATLTENNMNSKGGWTYNHHHDLAIWKKRLYAVWATTPKDEDVPPYRVVYATSKDGFNWSDPIDLFPEKYAWASRFYFYLARNGKMLALSRGVLKDTPTDKMTFLVREIEADHSLGKVFTLFGSSPDFPTTFSASKDSNFITACKEAVENNVLLEQWDYGALLGDRRMKWHSLTPYFEGFYPFGKAFGFYHRLDGNLVGMSKMGFVTVSTDEGKTWSRPLNPPTLIAGSAKIWGQRTNDGRFAAVYNPDRKKRYPLVLVHGDEGIDYSDMRVVHGEFPQVRYTGLYKDIGPQYVRGIAEWADDGSFPDKEALWLIYSVNKEDIWISRVSLPVKRDETLFPTEDFNNIPVGSKIPNWNIYSPLWAPVSIVNNNGKKSLELKDADPFDNAHAVRVFPEVNKVQMVMQIQALQTDSRLEIDLCNATGSRPIRLALTKNGIIQAYDAKNKINIGKYKVGEDIKIKITTNLLAGSYSIKINDEKVNNFEIYGREIKSIERFSIRTGAWHGLYDKIGVDVDADVPDVKPAVFHLHSISINPLH